jgi:PBP1b-binding outer membrane lipoprotein LpoB
MKGIYAIAIVAIMLLMVGCGKTAAPEAAPVAPQQPAAEPAAAPVAEPAAAPVSATGNEPVLNTDQAVIDRLTKTCQAGNVGVCTTLKNKYGIDVKPGSKEAAEVPAEEPVTG